MQQQLTLTAMKQFSSSAKTGFRFFCYDIFIEKYNEKMRVKIGFSGFSVWEGSNYTIPAHDPRAVQLTPLFQKGYCCQRAHR